MKKLGLYLTSLLLGIVLMGTFYVYKSDQEKQIALATAEKSIQELGRLVLFEQYYRSILAIENVQKILGLSLPRNRMLLAVPYRIRYGIDMEKGIVLKYKNRTLIVQHPKPEIFDIDIMNAQIETFFTKGTIHISDFMPAIEKEKALLPEKLSREYGDVVLVNFRKFMQQFLLPLNYDNIEFEELQQ